MKNCLTFSNLCVVIVFFEPLVFVSLSSVEKEIKYFHGRLTMTCRSFVRSTISSFGLTVFFQSHDYIYRSQYMTTIQRESTKFDFQSKNNLIGMWQNLFIFEMFTNFSNFSEQFYNPKTECDLLYFVSIQYEHRPNNCSLS